MRRITQLTGFAIMLCASLDGRTHGDPITLWIKLEYMSLAVPISIRNLCQLAVTFFFLTPTRIELIRYVNERLVRIRSRWDSFPLSSPAFLLNAQRVYFCSSVRDLGQLRAFIVGSQFLITFSIANKDIECLSGQHM
jgi:hypothetical protein